MNEQMREALRLIQMNSTDAELVHEWATKALASEGQSAANMGCGHEACNCRGYCQKAQAQPAEPVAFEFQHEDTGLIDFVDPQQVEWGFQKNNPRWQMIGPVYRHPPAEPARTAEPVAWKHPIAGYVFSSYTFAKKSCGWGQELIPLYTHPPTEVVRSEGWLRAIDEALVCSHLGVATESDTYEEAKKKLNALICWNVDVATDPTVNGGQKLYPTEVVRTLETVALIAHHGGLAKLSESDALTLIRKLTINHHDWKMTIGEAKAALAAAKEAGL